MATLISADRIFGHAGDAVLITGGRVTAIGFRSDLAGPSTREERFPGATIMAGLVDAHFHPVGYTGALNRPVLKSARDLDDLGDRLREAARRLSPGTPLIAIRLDDEALAERRLPTRHDLDRMVPDRPVLLFRYCGHIAVANTLTLEVAGVGPGAPDPVGGSFDRDDTGHPTGVARETALAILTAAVGNRARGLSPDQVVAASRQLARVGLTGVGAIAAHDDALLCDTSDEVQLLLDAGPELAIPMTLFVATESPDDLELTAARIQRAGGNVRFGGLKLFADGSLGGRTAALRTPYADRPDTRGTHRLAPAARAAAQRAIDLGGMVAIHAIGDEAVARVLDLFTELVNAGVDPKRLRMEHASVMADDDLERMAELGIIASVQPAFLASEAGWLPARLGDRLRDVYRFRSMRDAGVVLAGGSDCPVEPPHPLHGIAAAVDRHGIVPEEAIDLTAAVEMFTVGAAAALGAQPPLEIGGPAHVTVVAGDVTAMSPADLRGAEVVGTFVHGATVALPDDDDAWLG